MPYDLEETRIQIMQVKMCQIRNTTILENEQSLIIIVKPQFHRRHASVWNK